MKTQEIKFKDQNKKYSIIIGKNILRLLSSKIKTLCPKTKKIAIIFDKNISHNFKAKISKKLKNYQVFVYEFKANEKSKSFLTVKYFLQKLLSNNLTRSDLIIGVGGGITGDLVSFIASIYKRGINYISVPTTLLSQVDASVGGKTGVNSKQGKNLIGSFYQPKLVLSDISFLKSLKKKDMICGYAEILKHAIIKDKSFFNWLNFNTQFVMAQKPDKLIYAIKKSCQIKLFFVNKDVTENNLRMILNFGHTFGHAIEAMTEYTEYLHGEAVAIGMTMAADISSRLGYLSGDQAKQIKTTIADAGLPTTPPDFPIKDWLNTMGMDKKVVDGELRLVLAEEIGKACGQCIIIQWPGICAVK